MKRKLLYLAIVALLGGSLVIVVIREPAPAPKPLESELPTAMSNYHRTFKLDTSPAIFPDGKTTNRLEP